LNILVLVGLEKLSLSVFMLLVLILIVAQLTIKLIQSVFLLLDNLMALTNLHGGAHNGLLFRGQEALDVMDPLIVVIDLSAQDRHSLVLSVELAVQTHALLPKAGQLLVGLVTHLLLLLDEALLVGDLLPQVEVHLVVDAGLLSETS
jgi:hypothetical protein